MKHLSFVIIAVLFISCISSQKYLQRGQYNKALEKSVRKLQRRPDKPDEIKVLKQAYPKANEEDMERIRYLNMEGDPGRWDEILQIYKRMKNRQDHVETVLPLKVNGETVDFKHVDYTSKIVEAKKNAAEFHYNKGMELMKTRNKDSYREAYAAFKRAKSYYPNFRDVNEQMEAARDLGTILTLITVENNSDWSFSEDFYEEVLSFGTAGLNSTWHDFIVKPERDNFDYDYVIYASIAEIEAGPEKTTKDKYTKEKKIQDGWEYVLDEDGNVKKDSLGNDIKRPDFKEIKCRVIENTQYKALEIKGGMKVVNNRKNQVVVNTPVKGKGEFRHTYIVANGDLRALPKKLREKVGGSPVAYPDDEDLLLEAAEDFRRHFRGKIYANKRYMK